MVGAKTAEAGQFERTSVNNRCTVISKARLELPIVRSSVRNSSSPSGMLQSCHFAFVPGIFSVPFKYPLVQSIDRTPRHAALSLSCSPFATRRILFLDSGERRERGGLAKALDRNERPFCAALRWARSLSRLIGRLVGRDCGAMPSSIANQPSFVASGLTRETH